MWMITGDKQETAINIGVSCKLVTDVDTIMIINVDEKSGPEECERQARQRLRELLESTAELLVRQMPLCSSPALAVPGCLLHHMFASVTGLR